MCTRVPPAVWRAVLAGAGRAWGAPRRGLAAGAGSGRRRKRRLPEAAADGRTLRDFLPPSTTQTSAAAAPAAAPGTVRGQRRVYLETCVRRRRARAARRARR